MMTDSKSGFRKLKQISVACVALPIAINSIVALILYLRLGWRADTRFALSGVADWGMYLHAIVPLALLVMSVVTLLLLRRQLRVAVLMLVVTVLFCGGTFYIEIERNFYAVEDSVPHFNWMAYIRLRERLESPLVYGYLDSSGKRVIEPKFETASGFSEGLAVVRIGNNYGFINTKGESVISPQFDEAGDFYEGLAVVKVGGKYGYIDANGAVAIAPSWDDAWPFSEDMAAVRSERNWGFIDRQGNVIIPPQYDRISCFSCGMALVVTDGNYAYIDRKGNTLDIGGKRVLDAGPFQEGLAPVKYPDAGYKWGYIDLSGKAVISPSFRSASGFSNGRAIVGTDTNKKAFIDTAGKIIFVVDKGLPFDFSEGLAPISWNDHRWAYHQKYKQKYVDTGGNTVFECDFVRAGDYHSGLARFRTRAGRWGYMDPNGTTVIKPVYDDAWDYSEGLARVGVRYR